MINSLPHALVSENLLSIDTKGRLLWLEFVDFRRLEDEILKHATSWTANNSGSAIIPTSAGRSKSEVLDPSRRSLTIKVIRDPFMFVEVPITFL